MLGQDSNVILLTDSEFGEADSKVHKAHQEPPASLLSAQIAAQMTEKHFAGRGGNGNLRQTHVVRNRRLLFCLTPVSTYGIFFKITSKR